MCAWLMLLGGGSGGGSATLLLVGAVVMEMSHCLLPRQQRPNAGALGAWLWLC